MIEDKSLSSNVIINGENYANIHILKKQEVNIKSLSFFDFHDLKWILR